MWLFNTFPVGNAANTLMCYFISIQFVVHVAIAVDRYRAIAELHKKVLRTDAVLGENRTHSKQSGRRVLVLFLRLKALDVLCASSRRLFGKRFWKFQTVKVCVIFETRIVRLFSFQRPESGGRRGGIFFGPILGSFHSNLPITVKMFSLKPS